MLQKISVIVLLIVVTVSVDVHASEVPLKSSGSDIKVDSLNPTNRVYLNDFCNFHPQSSLCYFTPNPVPRPPYTPPVKPGEPIPGIPGPGGPGTPPTPFAGCGAAASLCYPPTGKNVPVSGAGQLQAALNNAQPGDHLILAGGNYSGNFTYNKNGNAGNPIVIQAAGGANVVFTGSFNMNGSYGVLSRVRFQGGTAVMNGHHNRITRSGFGNAGGKNLIEMGGGPHMCNRIDHNEFKSFTGTAIEISAQRDASKHQGHRIDHNYFFDHHVGGSEEVARMLTDAYRDSYITYDYNLFDRVLQGERHQSETISVKTARTLLLGNTITNSGNAGFTFRETNRSTAQNNYLEGGADLKIFGDDNIVKGNTITGGGSIEIRGGDGTMETTRAGCKKSGLVPVLPNCKGVHAAARRTQAMDNVGQITVGNLYSGNTLKAQDTVLTNNTGPVRLLAGQEGTRQTPGSPSPSATKLTPSQVGFSVGDSSCSGN